MQKYNGQLINQFANKVFGNSAAGVLVTVREKETGNLATLYADNDVDGAGLSNPLTSDTVGAFSFYAADGVYTLDFSYSGTPQQVIQLQDVGVLQQQFEDAVLNAGYIPSGAFSAGATLTQANQVLSDGSSYWRWDGSFPKVVSAGSSPTPTGVSNWILVSDGAFRGDLAAGGSTELVAGVEAANLARKYEEFATVEDYGAISDGATDDAAAFLSMHTALGYVGLSPKATYFISALPNVASLVIIGREATVRYSTLLIDRTFTLLDIQNVNFDARNANLTRCIRVRKNSRIKFRNLNGYNINSTTFVRMLDISTENVNIDIQDCYCQNLASAEDGTVGNNNGATRFIYVGDEDATPLVSPSFGRIVGIRGNVLLPKEDGDMIHVQSADAKIFNIMIDDIFGYKVAKRVVKVQANGVYVSNVVADARDNPVAMYAIVSHYGQFGTISNVSGAGKFEQGVDTQHETTQISDVNITNTGTAVSQGAALKADGACFARNITGFGFQHVVGNYNSLQVNGNSDIAGVFGSATSVPVFVRAAVVCGKVEIANVRAAATTATRLIQVTRTSSNTFTTAEISDVSGSCGLFTAIDVTGAAVTKIKDIDVNQTVSGNPVTINAGEAYCENIAGRGTTTDAVFLNATTKAVITRARGGTSAQVLTTGCNNTIVNNAICAAGVPASRNTGTASTNTQNIGTLTFA